jgi:hypothetical protein
MNIVKSVFTAIGNLTYGERIKKAHKTEIEQLTKDLDDIKFNKLKDTLIELVKSTKYTKKLKETLDQLQESLEQEGLTKEDECNLIEDAIKEIEDENLESILDNECHRYNKFTEKNPAENVSYDSKNKKYVYRNEGDKKTKKELADLIVHIKTKDKFTEIFRKFVLNKISYKNKKIIIYISENKAYFDLNHVINLLDDLSDKSKVEKYQNYRDKIVAKEFRDNKYGGFYVKEFIDQETFFKILLNSNSLFSTKFKDDVAKLLDKLTNTGNLMITNDALTIQVQKPQKEINNELLTGDYIYTQTYDNDELVGFIKHQIKDFKKVNWIKYLDKHVMYFFVITLEDPDGKNRILCKVGYSSDLIDRLKGLGNEYNCKLYLIGLKVVNREGDEKEFHNYLKRKYPELVVNMKIGKHNKDEIYVFDIELYKDFLNYRDKITFSKEDIEIEDSIRNSINKYFDNMEERFENELVMKLGRIIKIDGITNMFQREAMVAMHQSHYAFITLKETNRQREIELKELNRHREIEFKHLETMKDKEIEILKLQLELKRNL